MRSFKICRIFDIDIYLDWTLLILVYILATQTQVSLLLGHPLANTPWGYVIGALFGALFIFSVLVHEVGHALVGQRFGIPIHNITLFVLGGMAKMDKQPETPKAEFWMAFAGPLASILFGILCLGSCFILPRGLLAATMFYMAVLNGMLGGFNLFVPAFPLDGGRVLRAIIWKFSNFLTATRIAALFGKIGGIVFAAIGLAMCLGYNVPVFGTGIGSGIWTGIIGVLIYLMARAELNATEKAYSKEQ